MTDNSYDLSKRDFLQAIGMIGGSAAMYTAMTGLNMAQASSLEEPPELSSEGKGKKLLILGAGLSGLAIALEMQKKGYKCEIIEARDHEGGRCQSARKGKVIQELGGEKQVCNFEHGQYLNIGPWRIPAEHKAVIHYCRELDVELQPMINESGYGIFYNQGIEGALKGKRLRQVDVAIDREGNIEELLAKAVNDGSLDDKLSAEDKEGLLEYLATTGLLDRKELFYRANRARTYENYPGTGLDAGKMSEPYEISELLKVKLGMRAQTADHPAVMFQAKGGMDQIPFTMSKALKRGTIKYNREVTNIIHSEDNVKVTYKDLKSGREKTLTADYCITTIPFSVLNGIDNNFSPELKDAMKSASSSPAYKIGLQFDRRFWEEDDMIYGGESRSDIPDHYTTSYPSADLYGKNGGVVLSNYKFGGGSVQLSNNTVAERIEHALMIGEKLHPGNYRKHFNGNAISMSWHKDKYSLGGASSYRSNRLRRKHIPTVLKGEKRMLFSGGGISPYHSAWMTGAIEGAWATIADLDKRVAQT
ncbi:MAG: flavin monoamine oxidase family protein [Kordiimonadaceae bacterium]|nr:flavin monoamine oxidase family protein [Kordiimonadaceae bacterium]